MQIKQTGSCIIALPKLYFWCKEGSFEEFFVQDGTVEYFNDNLVVLSASAINTKDLSKEFLDNLNDDTKNKLAEKDIEDHDRYILNHKLHVIKDIRI